MSGGLAGGMSGGLAGGLAGGSSCPVLSSCESPAGIGLAPETSSDSVADFGV